jgi:hypothetical protein
MGGGHPSVGVDVGLAEADGESVGVAVSDGVGVSLGCTWHSATASS